MSTVVQIILNIIRQCSAFSSWGCKSFREHISQWATEVLTPLNFCLFPQHFFWISSAFRATSAPLQWCKLYPLSSSSIRFHRVFVKSSKVAKLSRDDLSSITSDVTSFDLRLKNNMNLRFFCVCVCYFQGFSRVGLPNCCVSFHNTFCYHPFSSMSPFLLYRRFKSIYPSFLKNLPNILMIPLD